MKTTTFYWDFLRRCVCNFEFQILNTLSTILKKPHYPIIHTLIWISFFTINATQLYFRFGFIPNDFYIRTLLLVGVFYLNYSLLVPKLLLNKKVILYLVVSTAIIIYFIFILDTLIPHPRPHPPFENAQNLNETIKPRHFNFKKQETGLDFKHAISSFSLLLLFFTLSTSIRLVSGWYKTEKQKALVETQKVNSELLFLKAQLNPHFLFNTLNSIYSLANKKSDDTPVSIITLSELMRYMIYEASEEMVPLNKEIEHIQNYISLQLLRLKDSSGVRTNIHGDLNYKIEPLLLISFIENAFKYGTDFIGRTNIQIRITVKNEALNLYVYNTSSSQKAKNENSGIGLDNIKNRLNLLYPNSHTLHIISDKNSHEVNLVIKLKKNNS